MATDWQGLRDELEAACLDVHDGAPAGPLQASRVHRAIGDVLRRRGLTASVEVAASGQAARLVFGPPGPRAVRLVVRWA
jgi:hypothetical protein